MQDSCATICFPGDRTLSLDERYVHTQKQIKDVLEKTAEIIRYYDKGGTIQGQISCINRGCRIYNTLNMIMDEMPKQKIPNRMLFFYEIDSILQALSLALGLTSETEIFNDTFISIDDPLYDNNDWIFALSKQFKEHWENKITTMEKYIETQKADTTTKESSQPISDIHNKIEHAENVNREFWKEHPKMI